MQERSHAYPQVQDDAALEHLSAGQAVAVAVHTLASLASKRMGQPATQTGGDTLQVAAYITDRAGFYTASLHPPHLPTRVAGCPGEAVAAGRTAARTESR